MPKNKLFPLEKFISIFNSVFDLFSSENCDWWLAKHVTTGAIGYIPSNYVTKDDNNAEHQE